MSYKNILDYVKDKPALYAASTAPFWDDVHISKGMLDSHLACDTEAASRKHEFIGQSVKWIADKFLNEGTILLDLGCGPGIYTELFCKAGFTVTGIDFSKRSIDYATKSAHSKHLPIDYFYKNYLDIDFENTFDLITLIYCDFGVLSPLDRRTLLLKIKKALKPNGSLILDGMTQDQMDELSEGGTTQYSSQGFWSPYPHLCIQNNYLYAETKNSLEQYVIVTEDTCHCYNIWNQAFSAESFKAGLEKAGFETFEFYDDVTGKAFTGKNNTICVVAK